MTPPLNLAAQALASLAQPVIGADFAHLVSPARPTIVAAQSATTTFELRHGSWTVSRRMPVMLVGYLAPTEMLHHKGVPIRVFWGLN